MTAEQEHSLNYSLHNFQQQDANVSKESLYWAQGELEEMESLHTAVSKKRRRQLEKEEEQHSLTPPLEKLPRKNEDQEEAIEEGHVELRLIDASKLKQKDILLAYKRIWENLDLNKPADAKLEPFVWHKIRQYQQNK